MANEYLKRTPTSSGNRKIFTYAGWFKKNNANGSDRFDIFNAYNTGSQEEEIGFRQDALRYLSTGSTLYGFDTTNKYRDTGNWFHIVFVLNTTLESERKRSVIYINGVEVDTTTSSGIGAYVAKNFDSIAFNVAGKEHNVLARKYSSSGRDYIEGQAFDIFFVDGQALTPDVFGFNKDGDGYISVGSTQATDFRPGQWTPHSPTKIKKDINRRGGFGVNGFYLPMNDSSNPGADFHCAPNSIIKLKGEDLPQPQNGAPTTSDAYVSQLRSDPFAANLVLAVPGISINLITNGTFDSNTTGWTASNAVISAVDGKLKVDDSANAGGWSNAFYVVTTVAGRTYNLEVDVLDGTDSRIVGIYQGTYTANSSTAPSTIVGTYTSDQKVTTSFTATGTSVSIMLAANNDGVVYYDNVKVYDTTPRDYSADIKGSGTNKTLTAATYNSTTPTITSGHSPYGSFIDYNSPTGTGGYIDVADSTAFDNINLTTAEWTFEAWYKRGALGSGGNLIQFGNTSDYQNIGINLHSSGRLWYIWSYNGSSWGVLNSTGGPVIPQDEWCHIAIVKEATPTPRIVTYVNGVAAKSLSVTSNISYTSPDYMRIGGHYRGPSNGGDGYYYDGGIFDARFYSIVKYKGGFDVPKPYTPVGIEAFRTTTDTCKNNFATLNPLIGVGRQDQLTYSNGNLRVVSGATTGSDTTASSNMAIKGKIYCEFALTDDGVGAYVGIMKYNTALTNNGVDTTAKSDCWIIRGDNEHKANGGGGSGTSYGSGTWSTGDIIMMAVDIDNTSIWWGKNGSWYTSGNPATNSNAAYTNLPSSDDLLVICGDNYSSQTPTINLNFGQNPSFSGQTIAGTNADGNGKGLFKYAPPSGFLALCEDNLPTPAIADPGEHFKCVLYTGKGTNGSDGSQSIRKVGFQPDLVWVKKRGTAGDHKLIDVVRGSGQVLESNTTDVEGNESHNFTGFNSDGFDLGTNNAGAWNESAYGYVAWCWKAGGAAVSNSDGSITTQVSANQTAGFSIVKGTQTSGTTTFGHGLGKAPKMVITKQTNGTTGWYTYHKDIGSSNTLRLDNTSASTSFTHWVTDPTTSVFSMGSGFGSGEIYVAYCFAEIEGFSKFGSYAGNGSADGPFVYCGFKPAWVMIRAVNSLADWVIMDSSRSSTNPNRKLLYANLSNIEGDGIDDRNPDLIVDFLSNGFKCRATNNDLNNAETYIFAAFAESPFQTANAK